MADEVEPKPKRSRKKITQATPPAPLTEAPPQALVAQPTEQELQALKEREEAEAKAEELQKFLFYGDLSSLSKIQQNEYLFMLAKSLGLNPWTKPFDMIVGERGLFIYANKGCAAQIRQVHNITITTVYAGALELTPSQHDARVYVVIVEASMIDKSAPGGIRKVRQTGAVSIDQLQGVAIQNAVMKAHTKANRRATLELFGVGFADESELDSFDSGSAAPTGPRRVAPRSAGPSKELPTSFPAPASIPKAEAPVDAEIVAQPQPVPAPVVQPPAPAPATMTPTPQPVTQAAPPPAAPIVRAKFPPAVAPVGVKPPTQ